MGPGIVGNYGSIIGLVQLQRGVELDVVKPFKLGIAAGVGHGQNSVQPLVLGQQLQADGGLHFEAEVAKGAQSQRVAPLAEGFHSHRGSATAKPTLVVIEVFGDNGRARPHFHHVGKGTGIAPHPRIIAVAQQQTGAQLSLGRRLGWCG